MPPRRLCFPTALFHAASLTRPPRLRRFAREEMDSLMNTNRTCGSDSRPASRVGRCLATYPGQIVAAVIAWSLIVTLTALGQAPPVPGQGAQPVAPPQEQTTPPAGPPPPVPPTPTLPQRAAPPPPAVHLSLD